jgi:hypothetical protein
MTLEARELAAMKNFAAVGQVDQATVTEFVAMVPDAKRMQIAETLSARVRAGQPMQHKGQTLTLATMATIAVALA